LNFEFDKKVRVILGGAEETTWECMDHYFKYNQQPQMAFSPDGDFPIVNGEKGVVQGTFTLKTKANSKKNFQHKLLSIESAYQRVISCEELKIVFYREQPLDLKKQLTRVQKIYVSGNNVTAFYMGDKTLSRNPHKRENAIFKFARDLSDIESYNSVENIKD